MVQWLWYKTAFFGALVQKYLDATSLDLRKYLEVSRARRLEGLRLLTACIKSTESGVVAIRFIGLCLGVRVS